MVLLLQWLLLLASVLTCACVAPLQDDSGSANVLWTGGAPESQQVETGNYDFFDFSFKQVAQLQELEDGSSYLPTLLESVSNFVICTDFSG